MKRKHTKQPAAQVPAPQPRREVARLSPDPEQGLTLHQVKERQQNGWANDPVDSPTKTVGQIGEKVPSLTRPALSQHLHLLREGGLVHGEKQGQYVVYSLSDERLPQLLGTLRRLYCQGE